MIPGTPQYYMQSGEFPTDTAHRVGQSKRNGVPLALTSSLTAPGQSLILLPGNAPLATDEIQWAENETMCSSASETTRCVVEMVYQVTSKGVFQFKINCLITKCPRPANTVLDDEVLVFDI